MGDQIIKVYENRGNKDLNVVGVGEIKKGERLTIRTEHQPVVILENYPGLIDVIAEEEIAAAAEQSAETPTEEGSDVTS
jgi:hypothetical protein